MSQPNGPKPRAKRFLTADDVTDIVRRYEGAKTGVFPVNEPGWF